jgi:cell division protease FtsH
MKNSNIWTWVFLAAGIFVGASLFGGSKQTQVVPMTYSELMSAVEQNPDTITEITITNGSNEVAVTRKDGKPAAVTLPSPAGQSQLLSEANKSHVKVTASEQKSTLWSTLLSILLSPLTFLLIAGWWLWRSMGGGGGGAGGMLKGLGNSKITAVMPGDKGSRTFKDVAGCTEAKEEFAEIIDFLKDPSGFRDSGARLTKGVLLIGPPGTGKTLLAKAIAGEAGVPFFTTSGSGFVEIFVGKGASTARDLFAQAAKQQPCIIFIDEFDAVARQRGAGGLGGNDEREQTLNEILVQMDGFTEHQSIVVIAATNRPETLDSAVTRSGRFDLHVQVDAPDTAARTEIFQLYLNKLPIHPEVTAAALAAITPGFTGADIDSATNQAALVARRHYNGGKKGLFSLLRWKKSAPTDVPANERLITMKHFSEGIDRVLGGPIRNLVQSPEQKLVTTVHEICHAAVGHALKGAPVRKVTNVARAKWLGLTLRYKEGDQYNRSRDDMLCDIATAMGGRVGQMEILGSVMGLGATIDTGAANDFEQATKIARAMVTRFGMSEELGNICISDQSTMGALGRAGGGGGDGGNWGPAILDQVDREVVKLLKEGTEKAREVIRANRPAIDRLIECLTKKETLLGDEFVALWDAPVACKCEDDHEQGDGSESGAGSEGGDKPAA